ncbi:MAG: hypothetical protein U0936_22405 [Planctomycetaceae bacterium]
MRTFATGFTPVVHRLLHYFADVSLYFGTAQACSAKAVFHWDKPSGEA